MKRTLVLGAGMLGYYLRPFSPTFASRSPRDWAVQNGTDVDSNNFHMVDVLDLDGLRKVVQKVDPEVIINTAVYGNINLCEQNPKIAERVNHQGQRNAISVCNELGVKMVYISTNSVFCGRSGNYPEDHKPHPDTVYGRTKLLGEGATREEADDWAIFRITALFGDYPGFQDFVQLLIRELRAGRDMDCWDQVISPSYGPFVAEAIMELIEGGAEGVWHVAGREQLSRLRIGEIVQNKLKGMDGDTGIDVGEVSVIATPNGLPINRTLSIKKLTREYGHLNIPDFGDCVDKVIKGMTGE